MFAVQQKSWTHFKVKHFSTSGRSSADLVLKKLCYLFKNRFFLKKSTIKLSGDSNSDANSCGSIRYKEMWYDTD